MKNGVFEEIHIESPGIDGRLVEVLQFASFGASV